MEVINVEALKGNFYCGSIIMILIACFMQIKIICFPIQLFYLFFKFCFVMRDWYQQLCHFFSPLSFTGFTTIVYFAGYGQNYFKISVYISDMGPSNFACLSGESGSSVSRAQDLLYGDLKFETGGLRNGRVQSHLTIFVWVLDQQHQLGSMNGDLNFPSISVNLWPIFSNFSLGKFVICKIATSWFYIKFLCLWNPNIFFS